METKDRAAERMYPGVTFDCALPQDWVNEAESSQGFDVRPHFVWGYPEGSCFGMPLPLSTEGVTFLLESEAKKAEKLQADRLRKWLRS